MADDARSRIANGGRDGPGSAVANPITPLTGSTPRGMPLALNRAAPEPLRPWIARVGVTEIELAEGQSLHCSSFNEHPVLRIIFGAPWTTHTSEGIRRFEPGEEGLALWFEPTSRHMPLTAHGSFRVVTINFVPGAGRMLKAAPNQLMLDRIVLLDPVAGAHTVLPGYRPQADKRRWLEKAEAQLVSAMAAAAPRPPERMATAFETLCLTDPAASLDRFSQSTGVTRRTLERAILRSWGVSPGEAQRRARALDMAALLLGVALEEDEQDIRLRYFDQSHVTREMRRYFDMTPGQLQHAPHPLLRIAIEIRQTRRLELLARIAAGERPPWRDPGAEPVE